MRSKILITGLFILLQVISPQFSMGQDDINAKASFIKRFASNITWPSSAVGETFVVGVIASNPSVAQSMRSILNGQIIRNKKIDVKHFQTYDEIQNCPILYITSDPGNLLMSKIFQKAENRPTLIITEKPNYISKSDINFVYSLNKWEFEINEPQIKRKNLVLVTDILKTTAVNKGDVLAASDNKKKEPVVVKEKIYVEDNRAKEALSRIKLENAKKEAEIAKLLNDPKLSENERKNYQAQLDKLIRETDIIKSINEKNEAEILQKRAEAKQKAAEAKTAQERAKAQAAAQFTQLTILAAVLLLITSLAVVFYYSNIRRQKIIEEVNKARNELANKVDEINLKNSLLEESAKVMDQKNKEINMKNDQLTSQTLELEEQNRKITDSIRYAMTIQQALLPGEGNINALFDEHFILYMPKDIVSGDFYWIHKSEGKVYVAVVDCTGHGVPGAFMSTIGTDLLNEIVNEKQANNPAKILEMLHIGIFEKLRQKDTNNRDGMDVCMCLIRPANNNQFLVTYAGAKRPLYYSQDDAVKKIMGDSKYIGGIKDERQEFTNHELVLKKTDVLYLTSDGFVDSPNPQRKKLGTARFEELLKLHHQKPMHTQKQIFINELSGHQQGIPLRDDITVMGIRL